LALISITVKQKEKKKTKEKEMNFQTRTSQTNSNFSAWRTKFEWKYTRTTIDQRHQKRKTRFD